MAVAHCTGAMRLSEIIVTYLAVAAPFGVAQFLRLRGGARTSRALARGGLSALVWPATAIAFIFGRRVLNGRGEAQPAKRPDNEQMIERAKRALLASLLSVEELCEAALGGRSEKARQTVFAARAGVERHTGLSLAASAGAEEHAGREPAAQEMELCRLAGRAGDDLLLAGLCVHRRNVTRLLLHRDRARDEALHALASVRELTDKLPHSTRADALALRDVSEALLRVYGRAVELCSMLDDRRAVLGVARLLDAECARLRRLEDLLLEEARHSPDAPEGELCTTRAELTAYATDALLTGGTPTRA